ncbi:ATP-dependent DNA helicase [Candidimonas nitroreducens]|uniref:ATP-dependent DNA helicase n=1 Tax=Candidimonas nitroreducens TaxID=683354 RepID=UPI001E553870|nr:ATP-dependent DNA helicase [Candidimonas nitroreducens]
MRALCEFGARRGDLDLRFTPAPSAREGIAGHAWVRSQRGAGYQAEVALSGSFRHLRVRGRADGYDPARNRLEEIKTYRGDLRHMPENHRHLHWAQALTYAHLMCERQGLARIEVALVYFDIAARRETVLAETHEAAELRRRFEALCSSFLDWSEQELAHRARRDAALARLSFPYPGFREGQRPLAVAVYNAARAGLCLGAQAPTGIGKTIGTLFPLLKAAPAQGLDKIFFLTAKTPGRALALQALQRIEAAQDAPVLRVLELQARDKACEHPDKACHGESCPLAQGFYDRLPQARAQALQGTRLDRPALRAVAAQHQVCPYYLGQDLMRWCDVAVGDFNYYFDLHAPLYRLAQDYEWRVGVLVDEAHNLLERARGMYTAQLHRSQLAAARRAAPAAARRALDAVARRWNALCADQTEAYEARDELPAAFIAALQRAVGVLSDEQDANPRSADSALLRFYFDALHFLQLAELYDRAHSVWDVSLAAPGAAGTAARGQEGATVRGQSALCIRNLIPAPFLAERYAAAHTCTLFSATLTPWAYYADTLGLPAQAAWVDVASPFKAEQLQVRIARHISTRYRHRQASLAPVVELMAQQYRARPGNYLAFLSSFDYLGQLAGLFRQLHPDIPAWEQAPSMNEAERLAFLENFTDQGQGIGFAVLGGAFAEGVDLPGRRLIGAFIATLGLPQINPVNEEIMRRMDAAFGRGYDYAYLYPGLRKVVQAAGRIIRGHDDQGVLYLIDDRYDRAQVRGLLPPWWRVEPMQAPRAASENRARA